ncbi:hypothetical protein WICMUC_002849 [Wickerhamomyces mucosus]|uniref:C2H2-type domain-containing protein n=1 Tax=Wickerhamomyces mucosus TaxID=1378264 RepID=A0A9P8PMW7_9ASCO|nr:hypothetical protein WICMUC_002849 [Wickerhamomyces mucosus]
MGKAEFGTPKQIANQMKARGLQKLKWYCQVCSKQCRDDNGFKSHIRSESHLNKIKNITFKDIEDYSIQFELQFLKDLKNYHGEKKINANKFYNLLIQDKHHIHLNSTKWSSLSQFLQHINTKGLIKIDDNEQGDGLNSLDISYINNSSENIMKREELRQKIANEKSEEQLEMKLIENQIKRGIQNGRNHDIKLENATEREFLDNPIKIQLGLKKIDNKIGTIKKNNVFKINKSVTIPNKGNVFKKK